MYPFSSLLFPRLFKLIIERINAVIKKVKEITKKAIMTEFPKITGSIKNKRANTRVIIEKDEVSSLSIILKC